MFYKEVLYPTSPARSDEASNISTVGNAMFDSMSFESVIKTLYSGRLRTDVPVSYTHLDVYKRQMFINARMQVQSESFTRKNK